MLFRSFVKFDDGSSIGDSIAFHAHLTSSASIAANTSAKLVFDSTVFNTSNVFDTSSGEFTAPETGLYSFSAQVHFDAGASGSSMKLELRKTNLQGGSDSLSVTRVNISNNAAHSIQIGGFLSLLDFGEKVWLGISHTSSNSINVQNSLDQTYLQGYLIRRIN